jgi:hypothetical protein
VVDTGVASTLSMRLPSMSITSSFQFSQTMVSPVCGMRPSTSISMPLSA